MIRFKDGYAINRFASSANIRDISVKESTRDDEQEAPWLLIIYYTKGLIGNHFYNFKTKDDALNVALAVAMERGGVVDVRTTDWPAGEQA